MSKIVIRPKDCRDCKLFEHVSSMRFPYVCKKMFNKYRPTEYNAWEDAREMNKECPLPEVYEVSE